MNAPFDEIPVLPVVIPLALVLFAALLWRLRARDAFSLPRAAVAAALSVYAAGIVGNTIFPIFLTGVASDEPWTPAVALVPFADYEVDDAVTNILVFVPLGILAALMLARPSWVRVLAVSAGVSAGVELLQLAAQRLFFGGHVADVNDLLSNVAGGALGYGLLMLALRHPRLAALIGRFRWTDAAPDAREDRPPPEGSTGLDGTAAGQTASSSRSSR